MRRPVIREAKSVPAAPLDGHLRFAYTAVMLMVILGAGASFDSAQAFRPNPGYVDEGGPWRPPLANDLFLDRHFTRGEIVRKYPKLTHILPYLREFPAGRSVEQVLEAFQEQGKGNPESRRELASVKYYLSELLQTVSREWSSRTSGATNYSPLVREILRFNKSGEPICLVTFNYDTLLDRALRTFGFEDKEPDAFLDSHPILKLFKLHGSVDWCRLVETTAQSMFAPQELIAHADTIQVSDTFVRANATDVRQWRGHVKPIFPAIAIPFQTKSDDSFECPGNHLSYLGEMLQHVTKVLIIGWQAKEAHFLRMLRSSLNPRRVMVVGASEANAEATRRTFLDGIGVDLPREIVGQGGFTDFIVSEEGKGFFQV